MDENGSVFWAAVGGSVGGGAVTLVGLLAIEWLKSFLDRPLLKVRASIGYLPTIPSAGNAPQMLLEAMNPHSKPVTISAFGLAFKDKHSGSVVIMPQVGYIFPYQVDGFKSVTQWVSIEDVCSMLRDSGRMPSDLKWLWFRSVTGREYRAKIPEGYIRQLSAACDKAKAHTSSGAGQ